jgi:hypothetical protein
MARRLKNRIDPTGDALGWTGLALALIAAIVLDKGSPTHKWHAAVMWTFVALFGVLIFGRQKRGSWQFWIFWATCLIFHVFAMWAVFDQLFPRLILGTLYVVPLAFVESILLVGLFFRLERSLEQARSRGSHPRSEL